MFSFGYFHSFIYSNGKYRGWRKNFEFPSVVNALILYDFTPAGCIERRVYDCWLKSCGWFGEIDFRGSGMRERGWLNDWRKKWLDWEGWGSVWLWDFFGKIEFWTGFVIFAPVWITLVNRLFKYMKFLWNVLVYLAGEKKFWEL